jgi:UDP-N-acetylglucosamine 2-epimerase (non-hydrolysing)
LKVLVVFGTRPEAIKLAPVIRELHERGRARSGDLAVKVCVTAQHREMLDQVLRLFEIVPDYDLNVMEENQTPTQVASTVLSRLEPILLNERPEWVIVQGDTTTVAAASLAAFYARSKVGHVEAGLRSGDKWQPFPEEINRRVAGSIADLHFAPTQGSRQNLLREGIADRRIVVTGNTVIDALQWVASLPPTPTVEGLLQRLGIETAGENGGMGTSERAGALAPENLRRSPDAPVPRLLFVTAHRRENFGAPLEEICLALRDIAMRYDGQLHILYAVHKNPNVWTPVHRLLGSLESVTLTPPLDYLSTVHLLKRAHLVLTDSGGLQEEAPSLGKPVLVLREITERPEGVVAGTARLVGAKWESIVRETTRLLEDDQAYAAMAKAVNPYGDGKASLRIVQALLNGGGTGGTAPKLSQRDVVGRPG